MTIALPTFTRRDQSSGNSQETLNLFVARFYTF